MTRCRPRSSEDSRYRRTANRIPELRRPANGSQRGLTRDGGSPVGVQALSYRPRAPVLGVPCEALTPWAGIGSTTIRRATLANSNAAASAVPSIAPCSTRLYSSSYEKSRTYVPPTIWNVWLPNQKSIKTVAVATATRTVGVQITASPAKELRRFISNLLL